MSIELEYRNFYTSGINHLYPPRLNIINTGTQFVFNQVNREASNNIITSFLCVIYNLYYFNLIRLIHLFCFAVFLSCFLGHLHSYDLCYVPYIL